jgi:hypothetical protein
VTWREVARLSDVAFNELAFQAVYAYKQGNLLPTGPARQIVERARRRVVQSKVVVSFVLALLAVGAALALRVAADRARFLPNGVIPLGVFQAGVLTGLLALEIAFLWWAGMQILPTFLSSGALPVLESLPIDDRTLGWTAGVLYLRLFDLPALTVLIATPLAIGLVLGPIAGIAMIPGALAVVGLSLGLSLLTGRFFLRRVQGSRSGGGRTIVRWTYLVLWLVPVFSMFVFVVAAPAFLEWLGHVFTVGPWLDSRLVLLAFPFSLASLPALAAGGPASLGLDPAGWIFLGAGIVVYAGLTVWSLVWVLGSVRRIGLVPAVAELPGTAAEIVLRPRRPMLAVLTKDLRIASRTPGYAFLILLPVMDAIAIGLLTYVSPPGTSTSFSIALAAVTTAAILATFFGPAFFAIEVFAYSYGRTLPISDPTLVAGKASMVSAMYLVAAGTVLGLSLARIFQPGLFAAFVLAELPAVTAAAFLELGLLYRRARTRGLPITNLYASAWFAFLVGVPGVLVAAGPLVTFEVARGAGAAEGLLAMGIVALAELAIFSVYGLGGRQS